jgi:hypothetical protein
VEFSGYYYCASAGLTIKAATLLSETCQLIHMLHYHADTIPGGENVDYLEVELRTRVFWLVYCVDM